MRYLSVCSGIEAATCAWHPLGWQPQAFAEIESFPAAVLAHHYPDVPNYGDMTKFKEWPDATIDVLVGGTPCQSFSVAGLRKGLADPRGNLMLTYLAIADKYRPRWLVWENVPGVLSSGGGADFGALLGGLAELGYGFAYRVLDAQFFGVAQRRRRVFVVGCLGDWRSAAAVLFERHSLQGHPAPSRKAGQKPAPTISARTQGGGGLGTDFECDGGLVPAPHADISPAIKARDSKGVSSDGDRDGDGDGAILVPMVAHSLRGEGFDASEDDTGRGTPLIPVPFDTTQITSAANFSNPKAGDPYHPLAAGAHAPCVAFPHTETMPTLRAAASQDGPGHGARSGDSKDEYIVPVAHSVRLANTSSNGWGIQENVSHTLDSTAGPAVQTAMQVRRLTPMECERLQGFPDNYTLIPWRIWQQANKHGHSYEALLAAAGLKLREPAGEQCPDGPRYKALGNSMAVPCMRWLGERIQAVESIKEAA